MPRATMEKQDNYELPEGIVLPAVLTKVAERVIKFTHRKGPKIGQQDSFTLWEWEFVITDGEFKGKKVNGTTEDRLTTADEPFGRAALVRPWAETLLGREIAVGEDFDTDDVIGLACGLTVRHDARPKPDGGTFFSCPVADLLPATPSTQSKPPF